MKKKLIGVLLAATLMLGSAMTVFAASSASANGVTVTSSDAAVASYDTVAAEVAAADATVGSAIEQVNATGSLAALANIPALKSVVSGATLVSGGFFDVKNVPMKDGWYTFTLRGLSLSNVSESSIRVIHYNVTDKTWDVVAPNSVDTQKGTISVSLPSLSPVAVIATTVSNSSASVSSPKTGVVSDWAVWMCAAVVLVGVAGYTSKKARG